MQAPYRTHSGVMVDLASPDPDLIRLEDIAHHLARICRYGGAVRDYYSVASHSVYVSRRLQESHGFDAAVAGLLHDATEAFLGDMVTGLKRLVPEYKRLETEWTRAVETRFPGAKYDRGIIKQADLRARIAEARDLFEDYPRALLLGGEDDLAAYAERCVAETPDEAEWAFLSRAHYLGLDPW